jgi:hypothetical protein
MIKEGFKSMPPEDRQFQTSFWGANVNPVNPRGPLVIEGEISSSSRIERLKEKRQPSLGELNPMLFPPNFTDPGSVRSLESVILQQIEGYEGLPPKSFGMRMLVNNEGHIMPRIIARFELDTISEEQMRQLEEVSRELYGDTIRTRKTSQGYLVKPGRFPTTETTSRGRPKTAESNKMLGWYMGIVDSPPSAFHTGVFVYKDLGGAGMAGYVHNKKPEDWFFNTDLVDPMTGKPVRTRHVIEVREAGLYQTDIAMLTTEISSILSGRGIIPYDELFYNTYTGLNRLGTEAVRESDIQGLDTVIKRINRALFYPLGNLELSTGIDLKAGSVLLIGYMGTGKTHLVKHFLQKDTGTLLVPVDVSQLAQDLAKQPGQRRILPRVNQVFNKYQIPVVLHIDDVESIAQNDDLVNSTLLNLMAGVRDLGFYVVASTNYPEKLSPQLLQPQRFAHIIHLGLPDEEARRGILDVHATRFSKELDKELFATNEQRESILRAIARTTSGATARVLADICTEAKTFFEERHIEKSGKPFGLTEQDISGTFSVEDWQNGINEALKKYNRVEVEKRDEQLRKFAEKHYGRMGYRQEDEARINLARVISEVENEVEQAAARAPNTTN